MKESNQKLEKLNQDFERIKDEIASIGYIKKGSITKAYQVCRNTNCRCHKDKKYRHGPYFLLTTKKKARTKTFSVPKEMLPQVKKYIENYKLLLSKVRKLEDISEKIIKLKINKYRKN